MNKFQIIISPAGEEMVVLPKAEFDAMVAALAEADEDDEDVAIYLARKAELTADSFLPAEVSMAILRGEGRLKAIRKYKGLSQVDVAAGAGITQGFLSDLESKRRNLTDAVADSLAKTLTVPVEWIRG
ncbi:helix-turn-helix domain-containing protein [Pseudomonas sp. R2.Fl]|nr:helix-turn-helix domain-containing protein [Pseudomonas sp. R2.Fl]